VTLKQMLQSSFVKMVSSRSVTSTKKPCSSSLITPRFSSPKRAKTKRVLLWPHFSLKKAMLPFKSSTTQSRLELLLSSEWAVLTLSWELPTLWRDPTVVSFPCSFCQTRLSSRLTLKSKNSKESTDSADHLFTWLKEVIFLSSRSDKMVRSSLSHQLRGSIWIQLEMIRNLDKIKIISSNFSVYLPNVDQVSTRVTLTKADSGLATKRATSSLFTQMETQLKNFQFRSIWTKWLKEFKTRNPVHQELRMESTSNKNANSCHHLKLCLILDFSSLTLKVLRNTQTKRCAITSYFAIN